MYGGVTVVDGTVTVNGGVQFVSDLATGKFVITPNSKLICAWSQNVTKGTAQYIVGTYNASTGAITETGTATIVFNGTTVSVTGHGGYFDTTGFHD